MKRIIEHPLVYLLLLTAIIMGIAAPIVPATPIYADSVTLYWVGNGGNYGDPAHWATTSGGAGGHAAPTSSNPVIFDANSVTIGSQTIAMNSSPCYSANLDFSGLAQNITISQPGSWNEVNGNLVLSNKIGWSGGITFRMTNTIGGSITTNGNNMSASLQIYAVSGTYNLVDDFTNSASGIELSVTSGTLNTNNHNINLTNGQAMVNGGTLNMGSSWFNITQPGVTVWQYTSGVINAGTSTLNFINNGSISQTFTGGGATYNNIVVNGTGTYTLTVQGSNTYGDFRIDRSTAPKTVKFTGGTTQTVTTFTDTTSLSGYSSAITSTNTTPVNLVKSGGGIVTLEVIDVSYISATPANTWYYGPYATIGTNTTGWTATNMSSYVGTTNNYQGFIDNDQRKVWKMQGLYWVFYSDSAYSKHFGYKTSRDGYSWSTFTDVSSSIDPNHPGLGFTTWFDGNFIYYAIAHFGNGNLYWRRGAPNTNGTITWSAAEQTIGTGIVKTSNYYLSMTVDKAGKAFIGYNDATNAYPHVIINSATDGTWSTLSDTALNSSGAWQADVVALPDGTVYATYGGVFAGYKGKLYNSGWGTEQTVYSGTDNNDSIVSLVATSTGEIDGLIGLTGSGGMKYITRSPAGTWSTGTLLTSGLQIYPQTSITSDNNIVSVYGNLTDGYIYYIQRVNGAWDSAGTKLIFANVNDRWSSSSLFPIYNPTSTSNIGLAYMYYVTPFPVYFTVLPVPTPAHYIQTLLVENGAVPYSQLGLTYAVNNTFLANSGYIQGDARDVKVQLATDFPTMVSNQSTNFVMDLAAKTSYYPLITSGNTRSDMQVIPGYGGNVTTNDAASIELGNNFDVRVYGYIDTSTVGNNIVNKANAFRMYVSSGYAITADINAGNKTVTATGIMPGKHLVSARADGTNFYIYVDDMATYKAMAVLSGLSVTNNANPYAWLEGMSYADYIKVTVASNLSLWYQPSNIISGTTLPDRAGAGNNGTFNYGTNPATVSLSWFSFQPLSTPVASPTAPGPTSYISTGPGAPPTLTTPANFFTPKGPSFPGSDLPADVESHSGIPVGTFYFVFTSIIVLAISIFLFDKTKSLAAQFGLMFTCMLFLSFIGIYPMFMVVPFVFCGGAAVLASKIFSY